MIHSAKITAGLKQEAKFSLYLRFPQYTFSCQQYVSCTWYSQYVHGKVTDNNFPSKQCSFQVFLVYKVQANCVWLELNRALPRELSPLSTSSDSFKSRHNLILNPKIAIQGDGFKFNAYCVDTLYCVYNASLNRYIFS